MFQIISNIEDTGSGDSKRKRGIGLGTFDGFHRGHQELVRTLISRSLELDMISGIYTFNRHPALVSGNTDKISMGLITTDEEKIELLKETGIDEIICQEFTHEFSQITAFDFLEKYLYGKLNAGLIVAGFNFCFGKGREGNISFLREWAEKKGIEVIVIEPVEFEGVSISSSFIRKTIQKGRFETVNALLGREFTLSGTVKYGQKIGTRLGFPTANIYPGEGLCLPDNGVYATRLCVDGRTYESVTNIGLRPSAPDSVKTPIIETMILGRDMDLYGKNIKVSFLSHLRKEKKFDSLDELKKQVGKDIVNASKWHQDSEYCWETAKIGQIPIYCIHSGRFTGNVINISFKIPLSFETASKYSLLSRVLTATCKKYPSRTALSIYLDSLYGANITSHVESSGDVQVIHFTGDALHTWRGTTFPFKELTSLLFDIFLNPDFDSDGMFSKEIFESERANLITEINTRENDKTKYAFDKCLGFLTAGTVQSAKSSGDISMLEKMTVKDLTASYETLMNEADISVYAGGHIDLPLVDDLCEMTGRTFKMNPDRFRLYPAKTPQDFKAAPVDEIRNETKDIEQARICIAYKGGVPYFSKDNSAFTVLNNMLGGDVHSLLFDVVREKNKLAYSVFSVSVKYLSGIVLIAGVAPEKTAVAADLMKKQVERLANDDFDDSVFKSSMESVSYSIRSVSDDLSSMIFYYFNTKTSGRNVTLQDSHGFLDGVKREMIVKLAKNLESSVTYILTQEDAKSDKI
ncbi:MAG: bifunctional riboflavin kinase/FAD synthetase [Saccharofermentanales bacterium]